MPERGDPGLVGARLGTGDRVDRHPRCRHIEQAPHHWFCPAAQELPAYRLREAWLAERGLSADVNWVAVVLDAGCTRRDIHPD